MGLPWWISDSMLPLRLHALMGLIPNQRSNMMHGMAKKKNKLIMELIGIPV